MWAGYWNNRILALERAGVSVTTRKLRHHDEQVKLPDGTTDMVPSMKKRGSTLVWRWVS